MFPAQVTPSNSNQQRRGKKTSSNPSYFNVFFSLLCTTRERFPKILPVLQAGATFLGWLLLQPLGVYFLLIGCLLGQISWVVLFGWFFSPHFWTCFPLNVNTDPRECVGRRSGVGRGSGMPAQGSCGGDRNIRPWAMDSSSGVPEQGEIKGNEGAGGDESLGME